MSTSVSRVARACLLLAIATSVAACSDDKPTSPDASASALDNQSQGRGVFQRYVAIGTSVSAGVQSDGLVAASQATSWPAQLAAMAGRELTQPYIDGTGCRSPLVAPLATGSRLSGESAATDASELSCSALRVDVTLPVQNVAINGALAKDALFTTSQNVTDAGNTKIYARVLQPGATQVSAMLAENPKLVSVELGANELLNARSGIAIPGVTIFPYATWELLYDSVLDSVQKATKMGLVVGLINDVSTFPAFRRGAELWADQAEFAAFNVSVNADCEVSENLLFVPVRVAVAVATGVARAHAGIGPFDLSCAAGGATDQDFVLTPAEAAGVNTQMHAMSAHIRSEATRRGFAYFELAALYDRAGIKGPFSVVAMMTSNAPYGPYISLDGLHPSAAGQTLLARAGAQALNATYQLGIPVP